MTDESSSLPPVPGADPVPRMPATSRTAQPLAVAPGIPERPRLNNLTISTETEYMEYNPPHLNSPKDSWNPQATRGPFVTIPHIGSRDAGGNDEGEAYIPPPQNREETEDLRRACEAYMKAYHNAPVRQGEVYNIPNVPPRPATVSATATIPSQAGLHRRPATTMPAVHRSIPASASAPTRVVMSDETRRPPSPPGLRILSPGRAMPPEGLKPPLQPII
jgi:hypothetical protein